jgi:hypothetical protein
VRLRLVLLLGCSLLSTGCVQTFDATTLGVPATMASPLNQPPDGERFKVNSTSLHAFWGLLPLSQASLDKALTAQLVGGKAVQDLKITVRSRWFDILGTVLTVGLLNPRTVTFEGVVTGGPQAGVTQAPKP